MYIDKKNNRTIIQDNEFIITNLSIPKQSRNISRIIDSQYDNYNSLPLTIDLISRGYEVTDQELETIDRLNANELLLINEDPMIEPTNLANCNYYITEDGRVFKCENGYQYYGLNMETMEWENNQTFMDLFYKNNMKYSELLNFRDYYSKKEIMKSQIRTF